MTGSANPSTLRATYTPCIECGNECKGHEIEVFDREVVSVPFNQVSRPCIHPASCVTTVVFHGQKIHGHVHLYELIRCGTCDATLLVTFAKKAVSDVQDQGLFNYSDGEGGG